MDREELNARFGVTEEQLDEWAEACERGEYPGEWAGPPIMGRPPKFGEPLQPVTFKETAEKVWLMNMRTLELGFHNRSDYLRYLVDQDLANAPNA